MSKIKGPFCFVNSINGSSRESILTADPEGISRYVPYMINKSLSYFQDTVLLANEMNQHADLDREMQYDFLRTAVRPRRRFSKWSKPDNSSDVEIVAKYYNISMKKAAEDVTVLSKEAIQQMREDLDPGGMSKNK